MVKNGHALDWPKYSSEVYDHAQNKAQRTNAGIWEGDFTNPWEWRLLPKDQKRAAQQGF